MNCAVSSLLGTNAIAHSWKAPGCDMVRHVRAAKCATVDLSSSWCRMASKLILSLIEQKLTTAMTRFVGGERQVALIGCGSQGLWCLLLWRNANAKEREQCRQSRGLEV